MAAGPKLVAARAEHGTEARGVQALEIVAALAHASGRVGVSLRRGCSGGGRAGRGRSASRRLSPLHSSPADRSRWRTAPFAVPSRVCERNASRRVRSGGVEPAEWWLGRRLRHVGVRADRQRLDNAQRRTRGAGGVRPEARGTQSISRSNEVGLATGEGFKPRGIRTVVPLICGAVFSKSDLAPESRAVAPGCITLRRRGPEGGGRVVRPVSSAGRAS